MVVPAKMRYRGEIASADPQKDTRMPAPALSDLTLEDMLPHRDGMLLISEVLEVDKRQARTLSRVASSWPLADAHGVHPLILVEIAAQTAGVCNGWDRIRSKGLDSDQMGWLVAVKKADFFIDSLSFGDTVMAWAENTYSFENLREVSCELHRDSRIIGRATLQLFQANK
jgi:predicted hotdog family 3-hydroxylacyl-ACP dehydratase